MAAAPGKASQLGDTFVINGDDGYLLAGFDGATNVFKAQVVGLGLKCLQEGILVVVEHDNRVDGDQRQQGRDDGRSSMQYSAGESG